MERQMYLDMQRERDEARAENERLREALRRSAVALHETWPTAHPGKFEDCPAATCHVAREALNGKESP